MIMQLSLQKNKAAFAGCHKIKKGSAEPYLC